MGNIVTIINSSKTVSFPKLFVSSSFVIKEIFLIEQIFLSKAALQKSLYLNFSNIALNGKKIYGLLKLRPEHELILNQLISIKKC